MPRNFLRDNKKQNKTIDKLTGACYALHVMGVLEHANMM
jgi:hypothetical protein